MKTFNLFCSFSPFFLFFLLPFSLFCFLFQLFSTFFILFHFSPSLIFLHALCQPLLCLHSFFCFIESLCNFYKVNFLFFIQIRPHPSNACELIRPPLHFLFLFPICLLLFPLFFISFFLLLKFVYFFVLPFKLPLVRRPHLLFILSLFTFSSSL